MLYKHEMANKLEERAKSIHISTAKYCKLILSQRIDSGKKLNLEKC